MARILVADDNPQQLMVQQRLLEAYGYEVSVAISPADALRELSRRPADLVVADLRIPTADDGLELVRGIRQSGYAGPLIVLSGWPDDLYETPEERMVSRVIVKGSARELLQAIKELLAPKTSTAP